MFLDKSFNHRSYPKLAYGSIYICGPSLKKNYQWQEIYWLYFKLDDGVKHNFVDSDDLLQMFRCTNVQMFRCSDVQMFRCSDVQMFKCTDVQMIWCSDVHCWVIFAHNFVRDLGWKKNKFLEKLQQGTEYRTLKYGKIAAVGPRVIFFLHSSYFTCATKPLKNKT